MKAPSWKYTVHSIEAMCQERGWAYARAGKEIEVDLEGTGHKSFKINPTKGVYLNARTGQGGLLVDLIRRFGGDRGAVPFSRTDRHEIDAERQARIQAAQRLWRSGWTCTHAADLPAGWDRGLNVSAKGIRRRQLERQRDAVRIYLAARLGQAHLDHWLRQIRIGPDGQLLVPLYTNGRIEGVQRSFLDADGVKIDRKMLGRQGVTILPAPPGVPPVAVGLLGALDGEPAAVLLVGEGFETVAAVVEAAGWPGLACHSAGGLLRWAEEQARVAADKTGDLDKTPTVLVLADRDVSGTGQQAAARTVRILRAAGLRAVLALPPRPEDGGPTGGPKGSDWGDYPKERRTASVLVAHLRLAVAASERVLEEVAPGPEPLRWLPVRPAAQPAPRAATISAEQGRERLRQRVQQFLEEATTWQERQGREEAAALAVPTLGLEITTGMGKSSAIRRLIPELRLRGVVTVIVAKDRHAAAEYERAGAFWRHGREDTGATIQPWTCHKMAEVQALGEREHTPAQAICAHHCEHGMARSLHRAKTQERPPDPEVVQFFRERPELQATAHDRCWLDHQEEARAKTILVVTQQGAGPHDLRYLSPRGGPVPRVVLVDEDVEWAHGQRVGLDEISQWLDALDRISKTNAEGEPVPEIEDVRAVFTELAAALGQHASTGSAYVPLPEPVRALLAAAPHLEADWERPKWRRWIELLETPLRAYAALRAAARVGALTLRDGRVLVPYPHPLVEILGKQPVLLADATLSPTARELLRIVEGEILRLVGEQKMTVTVDPMRYHGAPGRLPGGRIDEAGLAVELADAEALLAERRATNPQTFLMAQKPKALRLLARQLRVPLAEIRSLSKEDLWRTSIQAGIGWWGHHDKSHNDWTGWCPLLWDQPAVPRSVLGEKWQLHKAAIALAGGEVSDLPDYAGDRQAEQGGPWQSGVWVTTGAQEQQSRGALYADEKIRAYQLEILDAARIQALGRARAIDHPVQALVCGGWPLAAAPQHGLALHYDRLVRRATDAEHKAAQHEAAIHQFDVAAARILARGECITRERMEAECRATGTHGVCPTAGEDLTHGGTNAPPTAPRKQTYAEWLSRRAPLLYAHLSTTGRQARLQAEAKAAAERRGREQLQWAIQITEALFRLTGCDPQRLTEIAWNLIEDVPDPAIEYLIAARLVLVALGETWGLPPPW